MSKIRVVRTEQAFEGVGRIVITDGERPAQADEGAIWLWWKANVPDLGHWQSSLAVWPDTDWQSTIWSVLGLYPGHSLYPSWTAQERVRLNSLAQQIWAAACEHLIAHHGGAT